MKILHSADWHLGMKNLKLPTSQQHLIKDEMLMQVQDLFRKANREDFDVILICGDLFHSKKISQKIFSIFFKEVESFNRPVLYVEGNHDENLIFPEKIPSNFIILDQENSHFQYMGINFYSSLPQTEEFDAKAVNILLLHGNIENNSDNDYINLNDFLVFPFDYIALGHIHQFRNYKKGEKLFAYSGSLFSNGFDEWGEKGYIEIIIENKQVEKFAFVPFSKRRYMICECDITGKDDNHKIKCEIDKILESNDVAYKDFVRVVLTGTYGEDSNKSLAIIRENFEKYFYFEIIDKSRLRLDIEKIKNEKLSFKYEFISLVESSDLEEEDKRKICEIGLEALKGEGLNV